MLAFFDVETTGLEAEDRLCALGLICEVDDTVETFSEWIKPPRKVRPEAMAVHHITNEMLATQVDFENSKMKDKLATLNKVSTTLVGHNISFDLEMLKKEGFVWRGGVIDTLKCTRHLVEEIDYFNLQYLRYELGLYKEESMAEKLGINLIAHTPLSDAFHVKLLYHYLLQLSSHEEL